MIFYVFCMVAPILLQRIIFFRFFALFLLQKNEEKILLKKICSEKDEEDNDENDEENFENYDYITDRSFQASRLL